MELGELGEHEPAQRALLGARDRVAVVPELDAELAEQGLRALVDREAYVEAGAAVRRQQAPR